jgi:hypothetical protein
MVLKKKKLNKMTKILEPTKIIKNHAIIRKTINQKNKHSAKKSMRS